MVDIWEHTFDFTIDDGGFVPIQGTWVVGLGWKTQLVTGNSVGLDASKTFPASRIIAASVQTCWTSQPFGGGAGSTSDLYLEGASVVLISGNDLHSGCKTHDWAGNVIADKLRIAPDGAVSGGGAGTGYGYVTSVTLKGIGVNPFLKHDSWGDCHCGGVYAAIDAEITDGLGMR